MNAVVPGIVKAEPYAELFESDCAKIEQLISSIGLGRLGTLKDVANASTFIDSDRTCYMSGQILSVNDYASNEFSDTNSYFCKYGKSS